MNGRNVETVHPSVSALGSMTALGLDLYARDRRVSHPNPSQNPTLSIPSPSRAKRPRNAANE